MHYQKIKQWQADYDLTGTQNSINDGSAWTLEGSVGRHAMSTLESGATMLPKEAKYGSYGQKIPSRDEVKAGTKGSFKACSNFWDKVESGEINLEDEY
jgi:hypothetical protein